MIKALLALPLLALSVLSMPARADDCDALVAKLSAVDDVHFVRKSPSGLNNFLASEILGELTLDCGSSTPTLFVAHDAAHPTREFFDLRR